MPAWHRLTLATSHRPSPKGWLRKLGGGALRVYKKRWFRLAVGRTSRACPPRCWLGYTPGATTTGPPGSDPLPAVAGALISANPQHKFGIVIFGPSLPRTYFLVTDTTEYAHCPLYLPCLPRRASRLKEQWLQALNQRSGRPSSLGGAYSQGPIHLQLARNSLRMPLLDCLTSVRVAYSLPSPTRASRGSNPGMDFVGGAKDLPGLPLIQNNYGTCPASGTILRGTIGAGGNECAVKITPKRTLARHHLAMRGAESEATLLKAVGERCPFIVKFLGSAVRAADVVQVLELLPCWDLYDVLYHETTPNLLADSTAAAVLAQVVCALGTLHSLHVVHRDVNPEHLAVDAAGNIRLTGFALAVRHIPGSQPMSTFCGTPGYQAPEVLLGTGYGNQVDYWACGVLLYEMLLGALPSPPASHSVCLPLTSATGPPHYPPEMKLNSVSMLKGLLDCDPTCRLNYAEACSHPFFTMQGIDASSMDALLALRPLKSYTGISRPSLPTEPIPDCPVPQLDDALVAATDFDAYSVPAALTPLVVDTDCHSGDSSTLSTIASSSSHLTAASSISSPTAQANPRSSLWAVPGGCTSPLSASAAWALPTPPDNPISPRWPPIQSLSIGSAEQNPAGLPSSQAWVTPPGTPNQDRRSQMLVSPDISLTPAGTGNLQRAISPPANPQKTLSPPHSPDSVSPVTSPQRLFPAGRSSAPASMGRGRPRAMTPSFLPSRPKKSEHTPMPEVQSESPRLNFHEERADASPDQLSNTPSVTVLPTVLSGDALDRQSPGSVS
eukprot:gene8520-1525_t